MCISTTPRNPVAFGRRPAVGAAHLLSQVNVKQQELVAPAQPASVSSVSVEEQQTTNCNDNAASTNKKRNRHIIVVHNYHDHSHDNRANYQEEHPARGGVTTPFPLKLHDMLVATAEEGMDDIVSWQPHGRCFLVHKPKEFVALLPRFFKLSKLASFQRQLNLYGFQRLTRGRDRGGYYHELFLRNRGFLSHSIQRIKVKGTGVRARSNPDQEPDFWKNMPWVTTEQQQVVVEPQQELSQKAVSDDCLPSKLQSSMFQLPLNLSLLDPTPLLEPSQQQHQSHHQSHHQSLEDLVDAFERPFHHLDPFQPSAGSWTMGSVDALLETEADDFFNDFDFDQVQIDSADVEDDAVFGDLLEQMIA